MWSVYILTCSDNSYYIGHTNNIEQRVERHNQGRGSSWTAKRLPVTLAYFEEFTTQNEAVQRETQLKKRSHNKKRALIQQDFQTLRQLSRQNS
jgi:predicted GIY-YIG superfamily endonuclease